MFTGIVTDIGEIIDIGDSDGGRRLTIGCGDDAGTIAIGASIACSGICLTVTDRGTQAGRAWFTVEASRETVALTTLATWQPGQRLNLERALRLGDELGGHIVTGHIDGVATLMAREADGTSLRMRFRAPDSLAPLIAAKGSVALDGVSLTVNEVDGAGFGVNIIAHTLEVTTLGAVETGDEVNIEIDMLARYVARLSEARDA